MPWMAPEDFGVRPPTQGFNYCPPAPATYHAVSRAPRSLPQPSPFYALSPQAETGGCPNRELWGPAAPERVQAPMRSRSISLQRDSLFPFKLQTPQEKVGSAEVLISPPLPFRTSALFWSHPHTQPPSPPVFQNHQAFPLFTPPPPTPGPLPLPVAQRRELQQPRAALTSCPDQQG